MHSIYVDNIMHSRAWQEHPVQQALQSTAYQHMAKFVIECIYVQRLPAWLANADLL